MKRKISLGLLTALLVLCLAAMGQTPAPVRTFTDVLTPQATAGTALTLYKSQVEGFLIADGQAINQLQTATASIAQDEAQIAQMKSDIATLKARLDALTAPPAIPGTPAKPPVILDFSAIPDGNAPTSMMLNGITITFSPGNWVFKGGYLSPFADSQPNRSIGFSPVGKVFSVTYNGASIKLADGANAQTATGGQVATDSILVTNWSVPTSSITVSGTVASATLLKIKGFQIAQ